MADAEGGETLPCKRRALNSKEIFKKSGPKREASCMPEQSTELTADARAELESRLAKVDAALQMPHSSTGKSLIVACWLHERMLAKVLQRRGNQLNHFGHGQAGTVRLCSNSFFLSFPVYQMISKPNWGVHLGMLWYGRTY